MKQTLLTVVEHPNYLKRAEKLLTVDQMFEVVDIVAYDPRAGELIRGTGGFRKFRYAGVEGKGKSGGDRIIHIFLTLDQEVHLLDIYGKGEKDNLSKEERNELSKLASMLKSTQRNKKQGE